jgi:hypothetical protein
MDKPENLEATLAARTFQNSVGNSFGCNSDVVTTLSIPVFTMKNSIQGMD